jgi:dihydrolipoamide dehydrogenase
MTSLSPTNMFDLVILGGGPAGGAAAAVGASLGKKVVLIERDRLGGT